MKQEIDTIHFYHTNDIHSHFENWPQITRLLQNRREQHTKVGEAVYIFDIGDHVDRSHPFTEGTEGKGNIQLLNEAGYDAVTIGNNEGITLPKESLSSLYTDAQFDVVLGNLLEEDGKAPRWAVPSVVYETEKGTRIGVIGATAMYPDFYSKLGWTIFPPREQLHEEALRLVEVTDLIVCLSHMGLPEDERLAAQCPHIDIIFGAHTHHVLPTGKNIRNTLLAATGKYGEYTGHVTVQFDTVQKRLVAEEALLYPSEALPVNQADVEQVNILIETGKKAMKERVFYNPHQLKQHLFAPSELSSFFGRALIDYTEADCALFNAGIFLGSLTQGWVTKADLHSLLPHPINVCVITLDGEELLEVYALSLNEEWSEIKVRGLGFRGELMGAMIHERLYENRNGQLFAGNRVVVPGETYTLATLDMFTFGFFFPSLQHAEKEYYMPELIRDVIGEYGRLYFGE